MDMEISAFIAFIKLQPRSSLGDVGSREEFITVLYDVPSLSNRWLTALGFIFSFTAANLEIGNLWPK